MKPLEPQPYENEIPGFYTKWLKGPRPGEVEKILRDTNTGEEIHLHRHPEGLTISRYVDGKPVECYNFDTGKQEK